MKFYLTPIKDNFFTLLGDALKFHTAPLKSELRGDYVALELYATLLGGEFCTTFARCFGILRRAKRRLNLKFTRCFAVVKFRAEIPPTIFNTNFRVKFRRRILGG